MGKNSSNTDNFLDDFMESMSNPKDEEDLILPIINKNIGNKDQVGNDEVLEPVSPTNETLETIPNKDLDEVNNVIEEETKFESVEIEVDTYELGLPGYTRGDDEIGDIDFDTLEDMDEYESGLSQEALTVLNWRPDPPLSSMNTILNEWITTGWIGLLHIDQVLTEAIITGASDVHITANQRVSMSRNGDIIRYDGYVIPDGNVMHQLIHDGILSHQEQAEFNREFEYDGAYTLQYGPFIGRRTRINVGRSFGEYFIVFRIINEDIPSLTDLEVEDEIVKWAEYPNGLFLLCGPTGTGKSTTLASVVHNIQLTSSKKIITIEKPIEYIYPDNTSSLVVQREVGGDTRGFYEGLTSAMRQNPDIILLGEVRNTEEVTELLRAAETGHLAISTMHTNSVATTINRIQNLFTGNEQKRIMSTLADTLRGIGNQVLIKTKDGEGRFAVRELLTVNNEIKDLIIKGDIQGIRRYQINRGETMEQKLARATLDGRCSKEEALKQVVDRELFENHYRELKK